MAKDINIKINVDSTDADKAVVGLDSNIGKLSKSTDKVTDASKDASKGLKDVASNGGAIAILDSITGGLATKLRDAFEATKLLNFSLLATRKALIATGVGAFVVILGTIVAYWEDIKEFITGANKALERQIELSADYVTELDHQLKSVGLQLQIANKLGLSTDALIKKEKNLLKNKKDTLLIDLERLKTQLASEESMAREVGYSMDWKKLFQLEDSPTLISDEEKAKIDETKKQIKDIEITLLSIGLALSDVPDPIIPPIEPVDPVDPVVDPEGNTSKEDIDKDVLTEEEKQARIQEVKDYYFLKGLEREISEIERKTEAQIAELEALGAHKDLIEQIEQESADRIAGITQKYSDAVVKTAEETEDKKVDIVAVGIGSVNSLNQAASALTNALSDKDSKEGEERAKQSFEVQKTMKLATGAMSVTEGIINAFSQTTDPTPTQSLRMINGGVAAAIGLANLATIATTTYDSGKSGGAAPAPQQSVAPPSFNLVEGTADNQLQSSIDNQFDNAPPLKAYVVSTEVTSQQSLDRQIESGSGV